MNNQQVELTVHEQLKEICDKIGYQMPWKLRYSNESWYWNISTLAITDEREIIFTDEFITKFVDYYRHSDNIKIEPCNSLTWTFYKWLINNLDNPCLYLYNLIK